MNRRGLLGRVLALPFVVKAVNPAPVKVAPVVAAPVKVAALGFYGTAPAPRLSFSNDPNTGVFLDGKGALNFVVGGRKV